MDISEGEKNREAETDGHKRQGWRDKIKRYVDKRREGERQTDREKATEKS